MTLEKSLYERCLHAVLFEVIALLLCAPVMSLLMGVSFAQAGALTLMMSTVAMVWNIVFNSIFDHLERRWKLPAIESSAIVSRGRGLGQRLVHAITFEIGLLVFLVPLAAWWLGVTLMEALALDIGLLLFFLPYTLVFNWCYDKLREGILRRASC